MEIINKQKTYWFWEDKLFYVYRDGTVYELTEWYTKGVWKYWIKPKRNDEPIYKIHAKSKVDRAMTVQTGKLTMK